MDDAGGGRAQPARPSSPPTDAVPARVVLDTTRAGTADVGPGHRDPGGAGAPAGTTPPQLGNAMNRAILTLGLGIALLAAAPAPAQQTGQQNGMAACNDAAGKRQLAGDARKAFMSQRLSSGV